MLLIPQSAKTQVPLQIDNLVVNVQGTDVEVTWQTNHPADARIDLGLDDTYGRSFYAYTSRKMSHQLFLSDLLPKTTYHFKLTSRSVDQVITTFDQTFKTGEADDDMIMPVIEKVSAVFITATTATIQWETNEPASSSVRYGLTENYNRSRGSGGRTTEHEVTLRGLTVGRQYHYQVQSVDKEGNKSTFHDLTFRTLTSVESERATLKIFDIRPLTANDSQIGSNEIIISWRTNKLTDAHLAYGLGSRLNMSASGGNHSKFAHSLTLSGLSAGQKYSFRITSKDIFGKSVKSDVLTFVTKSSSRAADRIVSKPVTGMTFYARFDKTTNADFARGNPVPAATGTVTLNPHAGKSGGSVYLGSGGQLNYSGSDNFNIQEGTVVMWIRPIWSEDDDKNHGILSLNPQYSKPSDKYFGLEKWKKRIGKTNAFIFHLENSDDKDEQLTVDDSSITSGDWHYVAFTWRYGGEVILYIDGVSEVHGSIDGFPPALGSDVYIGKTNNGDSEVFIDEFAIFDRVLDVDEIGTIMTAGVIGLETQPRERVQVLGFLVTGQTKPSALYSASGDSHIYALFNSGQRYRIPGPSSLALYTSQGFQVTEVSQETLERYRLVHLVKATDSDRVYYLYYKPKGRILRIAVPSPTIFNSYQHNDWRNVVTLSAFDLDRIEEAVLVKTPDDPAVYVIVNGMKRRFMSEDAFYGRGYDFADVVDINHAHLDVFVTGSPIS